MADPEEIRSDLAAEHADLDGVLAAIPDPAWDTPTPAEGWTVRDQVSHLAFFDEQAHLAVTAVDAFSSGLAAAAGDPSGFMDAPLERGRTMQPAEVLGWWRRVRQEMVESFTALDPSIRIPWFGPPMSPASFISARLMETWAHGEDVVDAVGARREPTDRLRHIAFLGARARPFSYVTNGRRPPDGDVQVDLVLPSGAPWTFGDSNTDLVRGSALDFCHVVTQRRHPDDTDLEVSGPLAAEWISIAQCFAGPPGKGREPGQFAGRSG